MVYTPEIVSQSDFSQHLLLHMHQAVSERTVGGPWLKPGLFIANNYVQSICINYVII